MEHPPMPIHRRHFTGADKLAILREHLIEKVPLSDVCRKHDIQPTLFYQWQKKLFEEGSSVFESKAAGNRPRSRSSSPFKYRSSEVCVSKIAHPENPTARTRHQIARFFIAVACPKSFDALSERIFCYRPLLLVTFAQKPRNPHPFPVNSF